MDQSGDDFFRAMCEGLGFVSIAMDRDLRIVFWNEEAARQFRRSAAEAMGTRFLDYLSSDDVAMIRSTAEDVIRSGQAVEVEVKFPAERREPQTLVLILSPIRDCSGAVVGLSASMRDISERKRLAHELAETRRIAALGRMSGGVAHHFNNILGGMLTSIDYVLASDSPRELRRTLRMIAQAIGRATRITNQLAAFAESENQDVEWRELTAIVEGCRERLAGKTRLRGIELKSDIQPVQGDTFEAQRVTTVVESLAQNSLDAMEPGGVLTVRLRPAGDFASIEIVDTGSGIPADLMEHVFEPFFTTKGAQPGRETENIGLGLAAVHGIVTEMGGTIDLQTKVGTGTTVTVLLPLRRKESRKGGGKAAGGSGAA
jgi:PAS domain S-box-containing protein